MRVRRLEPADDRSEFSCGNVELDRFFRQYAGRNQFRHHLGTTYVAIEEDGRIAGFATVSPTEILAERVPSSMKKRLPRSPLPALRLARLAVDTRMSGRGVGRMLVASVLRLARDLSESVGCVVDAKTEAIGFYESLGFVQLEALGGELGDRPIPTPLFLPLSAIPA